MASFIDDYGVKLVIQGENEYIQGLARSDAATRGFTNSLQESGQKARTASNDLNGSLDNMAKSAKAADSEIGKSFGPQSNFGQLPNRAKSVSLAVGSAMRSMAAEIKGAGGDIGARLKDALDIGAGTLMGLGTGGPIGAIVGGGMALITAAMNEYQRGIEAAKARLAELTADADRSRAVLATLFKTDEVDAYAKSLGITAEHLRAIVKEGERAAYVIKAIAELDRARIVREDQVRQAEAELVAAQSNMDRLVKSGQITQGTANTLLEQYTNKVNDAKKAVDEIALAQAKFNLELQHTLGLLVQAPDKLVEFENGAKDAQAQLNWERWTAFEVAVKNMPEGTPFFGAEQNRWKAFEDMAKKQAAGTKYETTFSEWQQSQAILVKLADDSIRKMGNILKGAVESAMTPTSVTEKDIEDTKKGTYKDKWDEVRRRLEDVAKTPENRSKYGPEFEAQLKELEAAGYTAETAAEAFKTFAIYADPRVAAKNMINWGPIVHDVEQQLLGLAGKAIITKEAVSQMWDKMSQPAKDALALLGIQNQEDAFEQLMDPMGAVLKKTKEYQQVVQTIPDEKTTKIDAKQQPTFKPVIRDAEQYIEDHILAYDNVDIQITAHFREEGGGGGGGGGGGNAGANTAGEELPTGKEKYGKPPSPPPPPPPPPPSPKHGGEVFDAGGGFGRLTRHTLFWGEPGEYWWFSGAPPMSYWMQPSIMPPQMQYAYTNQSTANNLKVEFNGPVHVRDERDLKRIARFVTGSLRQDLLEQRRAGMGL